MMTPASPATNQGKGVVLFEDGATILHERVVLRLLQYPSAISVLERALEQDDGIRLVQVYALDSASDLRDFATADPYYDTLEVAYETIQARHRVVASEGGKRAGFDGEPGGLIDAVGDIARCRDEGELTEQVRRTIKAMGADQWSYQSISCDNRTGRIEHRYLIGGAPGWMQRYLRDKRFMTDPFVEYARRNVTPVTGSMIGLADGAPRLAADARRYGVNSQMVVPVHAPSSEVIGLLHVSNRREPQEAGEALLWSNRVLLSALAGQLLSWQMTAVRRMAVDTFELDPSELAALRVLCAGGYAHNVADMLRTSVRQVHRVIYPRICDKMRVSRIDEARKLAVTYGLIELRQGDDFTSR
ncbi:autoinducer binding domain-containing protein [Paraburkholderia sp. HD33-4]|uniref:autoinducer binding domain-containing protein n=1 Tax=Paraburkholderia sp. HD33-4 TaxID=2883242 RepID=UPI001F3B7E60|nr:autoinducer binding domain-containing protein [Paraburkholderia sp. HD33-4]